MRKRNSYPKPFKSQVVQECLQPGGQFRLEPRHQRQRRPQMAAAMPWSAGDGIACLHCATH